MFGSSVTSIGQLGDSRPQVVTWLGSRRPGGSLVK